MKPPFRADHVGSLLRPNTLASARAGMKKGDLTAEELRRVEDETILALVARQEAIGLHSITDGELRRDYWHIDFLRQLEGVTITENPGPKFGGTEEQPPIPDVLTFSSMIPPSPTCATRRCVRFAGPTATIRTSCLKHM